MEALNTNSLDILYRKLEELKAENEALKKEVRLLSERQKCEYTDSSSDKEVCFKDKYAIRILDSLPDMLTVIKHDGTLVELVSSEETNHVGLSGTDLLGKNILDIIPIAAYKNVKKNLDWVVKNNKGSIAHHDLFVDGRLHHYENRIFPLDSENVLCMCRDVTEATESKEELMLANRKMRTAEDMASLSYWFYYPNTHEIEASGIVPVILNAGNKSVRMNIDEYMTYIHPNERSSLKKLFSELNFDNQITEHKVLLDGKYRYFHTRFIGQYEKNGELVYEGYAQDMTYVVERFHELEMVKYAVNNAAEEIFSCRIDGTLEFANLHFLKNQGLPSDFSNYKLYELNSSIDSLEAWNKTLTKLRENNGTLKYTSEIVMLDGKKAYFEVSCYLILDQLSEENVWFFARDVSERIAKERKIKELNYVMDAILNNIPVYLFVKDPDNEFRYLYWNKAFEEYSGIPASCALGRTDFEIFPSEEDAHKFRKDDFELLEKKERLEFIEEYVTVTGGKRVVKTSKALVSSGKKKPWIIGVSLDITELKRVEEELVAARMKAEQSDRLKTAFLANISHEIRTPLNAIVGFSKLIVDAETVEEKGQYSDIINRNSDILLQLINDILDFSKIEAGTLELKKEIMDVGDLCKDVFEANKSRVYPGVTFIYDNEGEHFTTVNDRNRIFQVITNLITNACKFTVRGEIHFGFRFKEKNLLEFYVKDTGVGISEEKLDTIFERFIKLNVFAQGAGLGLAISKMIAEILGGRLTVSSKHRVGSEFCFIIPIKDNII